MILFAIAVTISCYELGPRLESTIAMFERLVCPDLSSE